MLIFLVVLGHLIEPLITSEQTFRALYYWVYSFHMPLFIFVSGYFSKHIDSKRYGVNIFNKMVIPYLIFEILLTLFDYLLYNREELHFHFFTPYWIMWFLFSMIIWKLILPYVRQYKSIIPISLLLAILIGYASDAGYYGSVSRLFIFFPYFMLGYFCEEKHLEWLKRGWIKCALAISAVTIFVFYYFKSSAIHREWLYGSVNYESLGLDAWYAGVYRLLFIITALVLSLAFMSFIPKKRLYFITARGKNTMTVFLLHAFIIKYLLTTPFYSYFNHLWSKALLVLFAIVLTAMLSSTSLTRYCNYIIYPTSLKKYL